MDPSVQSVLQFFEYKHLPEHLQEPSKSCRALAYKVVNDLQLDGVPDNPEVVLGLRKLLEAKDCFVRAKLWKPA